jgi:ubiquinone/menaquinone biosynthesis C-methylase UbiE
MFEVAEAYERQMGRWSRQLAPLLIEFVGVADGDSILDVGCGTGSLSTATAKVTQAAKIVGIDGSKRFIEYARGQNTDSRVTFELGDAEQLSFPDATFDKCLSLLVVNHIPNTPKAVSEMRRVTKPGGVIATAMWDGSGGNEFNDCMWEVATALVDPKVERPAEKRGSYSSPRALSALWTDAGLTSIEVKELTMSCGFESFDEFWNRYLEGQGPGGAYVCALPENRREALRQRLREQVLRGRPDGAFVLQAKAWAVRGIVPHQ